MRIPSALLAIPLIAGAVAGILLFDSAPPGFVGLSGAAATVLAVAAAAAAIADGSPSDATLAIGVGALTAGLSLGLSAARETYERDPGITVGEPMVLEGRLREDAAPTPAGAGLTLDVGAAGPAGADPAPLAREVGVRLGVTGAAAANAVGLWRAGRSLRVTAILRPPATYRNFGVPDDARSLLRRGIVLVGTAKSAALVGVVGRGGPVEEIAGAFRAWSRGRLRDTIGSRSARSAAVATAILIGDRTGIPEEDERRLQAAGTYHVIAISGGNIAILTALVVFLLRVARLPARIASGVTILVLLFYGQLTGAPPSVARAITAATVYLAARVLDHRGPAANALGVAAIGAVTVFPFAVFDPGFVLSFGATLGILLGVPRLVPPARTRRVPTLRRAVRLTVWSGIAVCAATLCAEIALLPVGAAIFARVTFAGLLLNLLAIPLMTVVQAASIATLATGAFPRVADVTAHVSHLATLGLIESARLVDLLPWLSVEVVPPALWLIATYYAACVVVVCGMKPRPTTVPAGLPAAPRVGQRVTIPVGRLHAGRFGYAIRLHAVGTLAVACSILAILFSPALVHRGSSLASPAGRLRVVFLDVGQGDATLVRLPSGRTLLVDAGGLPGSRVDAGERVVVPALRALGVRRIDTLVLTHADPDHVGGAASVMRRFTPRTLWEGVPVPPNPALRELEGIAASQSAVWRSVQAGDAERLDGVDIRIWHPPPPDWERQRVRNDDSVVAELRHHGVSILLTGDIEREAERVLVPRLALAPVVILKAPHHGSATSSTDPFIRAARPAAVVFSAGRRNPFGHPHPAVVARYQAAGAEIFRTDEDGAVVMDIDGRSAVVRTYSGRQLSLSR